jgi:hypothetical protein
LVLIDCFNNKDNQHYYISPENKVSIYYEVLDLFNFWLDVVWKYSNCKINKIPSVDLQKLYDFVENSKFEFDDFKSVNQIDSFVVKMLLWAASFTQRVSIIETIYKKTKSSPPYFYFVDILDAYLNVNMEENASQILIEYFNKFDINNRKNAILFSIINLEHKKYLKYRKFMVFLKKYQKQCYELVLDMGEKIHLQNLNFEELCNIINNVKIKNKAGL